MSTVDVLMIVDVDGALSSGDLENNIYLVDTNKHCGSGSEGQSELNTVLKPGDTIRWAVVPLQPEGDVKIDGFSGTAVTNHIITPKQDPSGETWSAQFKTFDSGTFQYTATLRFNDAKDLTFDPFLTTKS